MVVEKYKKAKMLADNCYAVFEIDFDIQLKKVINFVAILFYNLDEEIYEIIRYDCSHGPCHKHEFFKNEKKVRIPYDNPCPKAYKFCKEEILENWKIYLEKYKKKHHLP